MFSAAEPKTTGHRMPFSMPLFRPSRISSSVAASAKQCVDAAGYALYQLICKRFVASLSEDACETME